MAKRRKHWPAKEKWKIIRECQEGGATVAEVCRRHGINMPTTSPADAEPRSVKPALVNSSHFEYEQEQEHEFLPASKNVTEL